MVLPSRYSQNSWIKRPGVSERAGSAVMVYLILERGSVDGDAEAKRVLASRRWIESRIKRSIILETDWSSGDLSPIYDGIAVARSDFVNGSS